MLSGEGSRVSAAVSFFAGDEFNISAFATGLAEIFLMVTIFFSTMGKVYCGSDALGAESVEDDVTEGLSAKVLAAAEDGIESEEETELEENQLCCDVWRMKRRRRILTLRPVWHVWVSLNGYPGHVYFAERHLPG